jgi:membrane protein required for colicin V production
LSINLFDIVFVIILLAFTLLSFLRGAVKELLALLGLGGGFLAATHYAKPLAVQLQPLLADAGAAELLAFVLLMVLGYFVGVFLAGFSDMFRRTPESTLSQIVGGVVGFAKGVTISLALLWVVQVYIPAFQDEMADSAVGSWLGSLLAYLERTKLI